MKTRFTEVLVGHGEVVLAITDNDAHLAVRMTPEAALLLAAELASGSIQSRGKIKESAAMPQASERAPPLHRVR